MRSHDQLLNYLKWLKQKTTYYINTTHIKPQIIFMSISRIYRIINNIDDLVYIGSTTCEISKRMSEHRRNMRQAIRTSKLYNHMRAHGVQHFKIVCVREYTDISKERLHNRGKIYQAL